MVEIAPINFTNPIIKPRKIEREDEQLKDKKKQPQQEDVLEQAEDEVTHLIDEMV